MLRESCQSLNNNMNPCSVWDACCTARSNAKLAIDGTDVGMDGAGTENELGSYLDVSHAACQQAQDLYLACRQSSWIGRGGSHDLRRGWSRFLPPGGERLLRCQRASMGPGGSERPLSQVSTRC